MQYPMSWTLRKTKYQNFVASCRARDNSSPNVFNISAVDPLGEKKKCPINTYILKDIGNILKDIGKPFEDPFQ